MAARLGMILWYATVLPSAAFASPCPVDVALPTLLAEVRAAEDAFAALDAVAFLQRADEVQHDLPCVDGVIEPTWAARVHRVEGLHRFTAHQDDEAAAAFAAMRATDPTITLDPLVPPGHALWALSARPAPRAEPAPLAPPATGDLRVDGVVATLRPTALPFVFQLTEGDRAVRSAWVPVGGAVPDYPLPMPTMAVVVPPDPAPQARPRTAAITTVATGAVAIVTSVALYGSSVAARQGLSDDHPGWTVADYEALQRRTNGRTAAAGVLGGLGLGALAVGLTVGF